VNVFIDGTSYKNDLTGGRRRWAGRESRQSVPLERDQEFRVITQNYKAEYQEGFERHHYGDHERGGSKWEGSAFFYGQGKGLLATDSLPCAGR